MMGRKAARNMWSSNTNKIGFLCICWFYSQVINMCSEIHTKHINILWAGRRTFERHTWWLTLSAVLLTAVRETEVAQLHIQLL